MAAFVAAAVGASAFAASARDWEFGIVPVYMKEYAGQGQWVAIADVSHDGRDDLLNIVDPPDSDYTVLAIQLQKQDATLAPPTALALPMLKLYAAEAVDMDGDGNKEVVIGHHGGVAVYRWNGAEFVPTAMQDSAFGCQRIAIDDLDGNGTPDLVCASVTSGVIATFFVDAEGAPAPPAYMQATTSYNGFGQVKLGDVTGDGRPDLLSADGGMWSFQIYENDGLGGFLPARNYGYPRTNAGFNGSSIEAYDVDGDGSNEVVISIGCNKPCASLYVYRRGSSAASFQLWTTIATLDNPRALRKQDIDGDGRLDLAVAHGGFDAVGRFMGTATGLSTHELLAQAIMMNGMSVAFGDLNGDARPDLAASADSWRIALKYGMRKRTHDVSGNFQSDLFWRDAQSGRNSLWRDAVSAWAQALPDVAAPWTVAAIADFDDDMKADVFWRNPTNGANMIWRAGNSASLLATVPLAADWQVVGNGDFDGDAKYDILWRNAKTGENLIWRAARNDLPRTVTRVADTAWKIVGVGDFDGDHKDDILWRHASRGSNSIWYSGNSTTAVEIVAVANAAWRIVGVGDFNRDGMDDIVWRNVQTGANSIWRSANAAKAQAVTSVPIAWSVVAVADYAGDGVADILWRNQANGVNSLWRGGNSSSAQSIATVGGNWRVVP